MTEPMLRLTDNELAHRRRPADAPPVRYKGRIYVRIGPRRGIASAQDERILNEKRRHRELPFDMQPIATATVGDLERRLFVEEYLPAAFAKDVLNANERSYVGSTNRVEILSPGGPFGLVTQQNFGQPGVTDYRNPNIAEAMKTLGFVQRFGVGIATAQRALRDNGNPPIEWSVNDRFVLAIVRRS